MLIEYMVIIEVVIVVMVECVVIVANQQSAVVKWQPEQAYVKSNQSKPFFEHTESDRQEWVWRPQPNAFSCFSVIL